MKFFCTAIQGYVHEYRHTILMQRDKIDIINLLFYLQHFYWCYMLKIFNTVHWAESSGGNTPRAVFSSSGFFNLQSQLLIGVVHIYRMYR